MANSLRFVSEVRKHRGQKPFRIYTCAIAPLFVFLMAIPAWAGGSADDRPFRVLEPIARGNLAIFPVVS